MVNSPQPDDWRSYFGPGSDVLRNKLGISDATELQTAEHDVVEIQATALTEGDAPIEGDTAAERLSSIHSTLFGEIYDWAGENRVVNMAKGGQNFGDHSSMNMYLRQLNGQINRFDWDASSFDDKVDKLADLHTDLNFAHPFREGNGRSSRVFMSDLASHHGVDLDFGAVDKPAWNDASAASFLDPDGLRMDYQPIRGIYQDIAAAVEPEAAPAAGRDTDSPAAEVAAELQQDVDRELADPFDVGDPFDPETYDSAGSASSVPSYGYSNDPANQDITTTSSLDRDADRGPEL